MIRKTGWSRCIPLAPVACAALAGLGVTLWLAFGWKVTGLYEEWLFMSGGDMGNPVRMLYQPYASASYRPLTLAPYILGYILTPGSFLGFNLRALGASRDDFRWSTLLAMVVAEGIALATYDGGILLSICGPVLLLWLRPRINKRLVTVSALWWAVSVSFLFHLILTLRDQGSYAAELLAGSRVGKMHVVDILRGACVSTNFWVPGGTRRCAGLTGRIRTCTSPPVLRSSS
jgi:hypothetical protein